MRTVKWVDVIPEEAPGKPEEEPLATARKAPRPTKKKIIEVEPEPPYTALEDSGKELEMLVSAVCDHAKYKCKVERVHFKDTLMFQTRVFRCAAAALCWFSGVNKVGISGRNVVPGTA